MASGASSCPSAPISLRTHNPQKDGGHVLAGWVGDLDGVAALVSPLRALNDKAAAVGALLDTDPALGAREHLDSHGQRGTLEDRA